MPPEATARIVRATSLSEIDVVRRLFREYAASLSIDLEFQGFSSELAALPGDYVPPHGALLLAMTEGSASGCVALRPLQPPEIAELKRLYVVPASRGRGIGTSLSRAVIAAARSAGYQYMRLDTLRSMDEAQRLYERLGFQDIGPYRFNPIASARYMELKL